MSKATYFLRLILSSKECRRIFPNLPEPKEDTAVVKFVRQHLRLFLRVLAIAASVNTALYITKRPHNLPSFKAAGSVTSTAALYRVSFNLLQRIIPSKWLSSALSGAISSLGISLFVPQRSGLLLYMALYSSTNGIEWLINLLDDKEMLSSKPRWLGAWILFPIALGQLIYVFVQHPEACPAGFRAIMLGLRGSYMPSKPTYYTAEVPWPTEQDIMSALKDTNASSQSSTFKSPLLMRQPSQLSASLLKVYPVLASAHPAITKLSAALLHPEYRNGCTPFLKTISKNFKFVLKLLLPLSLLSNIIGQRYDILDLARSLGQTLRTTIFAALSSASAWASIACSEIDVLNAIAPPIRYRLLGFLSGTWALLDSATGRARFLYIFRLALLSQYNLATANGTRQLFRYDTSITLALAYALCFGVLSASPEAVGSSLTRKIGHWMQTGEWIDPAPLE